VEAQLGLAKVKIAGDRFKDAVEQLEPLSKSQPNNAEIFELLAQAYRGIGKNDDARKAETRASLLREKRATP
jgi:predicted Zn-dependent protease